VIVSDNIASGDGRESVAANAVAANSAEISPVPMQRNAHDLDFPLITLPFRIAIVAPNPVMLELPSAQLQVRCAQKANRRE
jgi:hypothetical protein